MKREDLNPAAYVRQQADLRLLKQEAKALNQEIDRKTVSGYRDLGKRLAALKEAVKHGEWEPLLKELGISSQRASEAVTVSEWFWRFGEQARNVTHLLELVAAEKGTSRQGKFTSTAQTNEKS